MSELKPCPFCGGKVNFEEYTEDNSSEIWLDSRYLYCTKCLIEFIFPWKSLDESIKRWNSRV